MFQRLVTYKTQHNGSTLVSKVYEADQKLGIWVRQQRWNYNYNNKRLSVDRIERLESIGFVWSIYGNWMKNYNRLVVYKEKYKSMHVPLSYNGDNQLPHLGHWVSTQRGAYTKGKLLKSRVKRLNSINFIWRAKNKPCGRDDGDVLVGNQNQQKQSKKTAVIAPTLLQKQHQPQQNIVSYQQQQHDILASQQYLRNILQLTLSYQQEQHSMLSYQKNKCSSSSSNINISSELCRS
jgi:hypothetical protein